MRINLIILFASLFLIACETEQVTRVFHKPVCYPTDSIKAESPLIDMYVGSSRQLLIEYNTTDNVEWLNMTTDVVSVTEDGIVKALKAGQALVLAKCHEYNGAADTIIINVTEKQDGYLPVIYNDWGATPQQIYDQYATEGVTVVTDKEDIIVTGDNYLMSHYMYGSDTDKMLLSTVMVVWGNINVIAQELDERYTLVSSSATRRIYSDQTGITNIVCDYVSAQQSLTSKYRAMGALTDFYLITFAYRFNEFIDGKLEVSPNTCIAPNTDGNPVNVILRQSGVVVNEYFDNISYTGSSAMMFRGVEFKDGDRVVVIGAETEAEDDCGNIYYIIHAIGMIHE